MPWWPIIDKIVPRRKHVRAQPFRLARVLHDVNAIKISVPRFFLILLACLLPAVAASAAPATRPANSPASLPAPGQHTADERKLMELTRKSVKLFEQKKIAEAAAVIEEALAIEPDSPLNLYNMACAKSILGQTDSAMAYLERSAEAGFSDFAHIQRDPDLIPLRNMDAFKRLMGRRDEFVRKVADRTVAMLRREFGEGYRYVIDADDKLIFASNTDEQTLDAMKKMLLAQARSQWRQIFDHKPDQYVAVVLPSPADYKRLVRWPGVAGFYNPATRILISSTMGQVLTHEFTHALHHADQAQAGQEHPIWLTEGLASLFEAGRFDGETLVPDDNLRLAYLQAAAKANRLIALEKLLKMDQSQLLRNPVLGYGQSSSLLLYLHDRKLLKPFYEAYKADYEKDATGKMALEEICGASLNQIDTDWRQWMLKRTPPPMTTGRGGAFLGVRFGAANDGLKIEEIVTNSPAEHAGLRADDLVVGLEGEDIRDYASLVRLLNEHKPGNQIKMKVRRGEDYKDIDLTLGSRPDDPPAERPRQRRPATRPSTRPATTRPAR